MSHEGSAAFQDAMDRGEVVWVRPTLLVDWLNDGYGGDGSVDDMSPQVGTQFDVTHEFDDGLPSQITSSAGGSPVPVLTVGLVPASLVGAASIDTRTPTTAVNGAFTDNEFDIVVPAAAVAGDYVVFPISIINTDATVVSVINAAGDLVALSLLSPPVVDVGVVSTTIYGKLLSEDDLGDTWTVTLTNATQYAAALVPLFARTPAGGLATLRVAPAGISLTPELSSSTSHTAGPVTVAMPKAVLIGIWSRNIASGTTWTPPTGDTELAEAVGTHGVANIAMAISASPTVTVEGSYSKTATTSTATGSATMGLIAVEALQFDEVDAARYFSPFNVDSPVYGMERDVARIELEHGAITDDGTERIRLFTGQMADIPVRRGAAALLATSATRMALSRNIQPPAVAGYLRGANASWLVSWSLYECGIYVAPPPRDGCRWYAPMHGSLQPFLPNTSALVTSTNTETARCVRNYLRDVVLTETVRPEWVESEYLLGVDAYLRFGDNLKAEVTSIRLGDGVDLFTQTASAGRVEMWVRGDPREVIQTPSPPTNMVEVSFQSTGSTHVTCRIVSLSSNIEISVNDGFGTFTLTHGSTFPADDEWHFVGFGWSISGDKLWVRLDADTDTSTPAFNTANLGALEEWDADYPRLVTYMPTSEVQITSGSDANPDTVPWLNEGVFEPTAIVRRSWLELAAIAETTPREAWQILTDLAQSDLAAYRVDEHDRYQYLPRSYFAEDDQQVVGEAVTTQTKAAELEILADPTKVRNAITIRFDEVTVDDFDTPVLSLTSSVSLPPGITIRTFPLNNPVVGIALGQTANLDQTQVDAGNPSTLTSFITANTQADGSGTYANNTQVQAFIIAWDPGSVTIEFRNYFRINYYLANDGSGVPFIQVVGRAVRRDAAAVTLSDDPSIVRRGQRTLELALPAIQRRTDASRVAAQILGLSARPQPEITVEVFGDPQRHPGDLISLSDTGQTRVSGNWRIRKVRHGWNGAEFVQTLDLRLEPTLGVWDESNWDDGDVWGP